MKKSSAGFTLIELVVVVAIVAILAVVGISAYNNFIEDAKRTEAQTTLVDIASKEEAYVNTWGTYVDVSVWNPSSMPGNDKPSLAWETGSSFANWDVLGFSISGPSRWSYAVKATADAYTVGACRVDGSKTISLHISSANRRTMIEGGAAIVTGFSCPE